MKRNRPAATLYPAKHGAWTVVKPDGRAEHADTLDDARRIAYKAGAILTRIEGIATAQTLLRTGNA